MRVKQKQWFEKLCTWKADGNGPGVCKPDRRTLVGKGPDLADEKLSVKHWLIRPSLAQGNLKGCAGVEDLAAERAGVEDQRYQTGLV